MTIQNVDTPQVKYQRERQNRGCGINSSAENKDSQPQGFFAWVHQMERVAWAKAKLKGGGVALLGHDGLPQREPLRFLGQYSAAFQVQPFEDLSKNKHHLLDGSHPKTSNTEDRNDVKLTSPRQVRVGFLGVAGSGSILPQHYTRFIAEQLKHKETALADFLDIFNHRLISLYYRAWVKYRLPYLRETRLMADQLDPLSGLLEALVGDGVGRPLPAQLFFVGHFQKKARSASNLIAILSELLHAQVHIKQFQGCWRSLSPSDCTQLASGQSRSSERSRLGDGVLLGRRFWDVSAGISLEIGPISLSQYELTTPGQRCYEALVALINRFVPLQYQVNLCFIVVEDQTSQKGLGAGLALNRNFWLGRSRNRPVRAEDVITSKGAAHDGLKKRKTYHIARHILSRGYS